MNNFIVSFSSIFVLLICGYAIGKFSGLGLEYYMPFLLWLVALFIFNMFLDKKHVNVYLKTIEPSKDTTTKKESSIISALKSIGNKINPTSNSATKNTAI